MAEMWERGERHVEVAPEGVYGWAGHTAPELSSYWPQRAEIPVHYTVTMYIPDVSNVREECTVEISENALTLSRVHASGQETVLQRVPFRFPVSEDDVHARFSKKKKLCVCRVTVELPKDEEAAQASSEGQAAQAAEAEAAGKAERAAQEAAEEAAAAAAREAAEKEAAERAAAEAAEIARKAAAEKEAADRAAAEAAEKAAREAVEKAAAEAAENVAAAEAAAREAAEKEATQRAAREAAEREAAAKAAAEAAEQAKKEVIERQKAERSAAEVAEKAARDKTHEQAAAERAEAAAEAEAKAAREAAEAEAAEKAAATAAERAAKEAAEKEAAEKAAAEAADKAAREAAEAAAAEKAAAEAAETAARAAAADKAAADKAAADAAAEAARQQAEQVAAEKAAAEAAAKAQKEAEEKEAADKAAAAAAEEAAREAAEKEAGDKAAAEAAEQAARAVAEKEAADKAAAAAEQAVATETAERAATEKVTAEVPEEAARDAAEGETADKAAAEATHQHEAGPGGNEPKAEPVGAAAGYVRGRAELLDKAEITRKEHRDRRIVLMLGPPGAGKTTFALRAAEALNVPCIPAAELERSGRAHRDAPQPMVAALGWRMKKPDCERGFVLVGFPATLEQARALDQLLTEGGERVSTLLSLEIPDGVARHRVLGRWVHPASGRAYHALLAPPKSLSQWGEPAPDTMRDDLSGEPLQRRPSDTPEAFAERLRKHHEHFPPLLRHYTAVLSDTGLGEVRKVDADQIQQSVWSKIAEWLKVTPGSYKSSCRRGVILIGPPCSGKHTHAPRLAEALGVPVIWPWESAAPDSADAAIVKEVGERTGRNDCTRGFLIADFPRTAVHGRLLDEELAARGDSVSTVLSLEIPGGGSGPEGRRRPSRESPDTFRERAAAYRKHTAGLLEHYRNKHVLSSVDASGTAPEVWRNIAERMGIQDASWGVPEPAQPTYKAPTDPEPAAQDATPPPASVLPPLVRPGTAAPVVSTAGDLPPGPKPGSAPSGADPPSSRLPHVAGGHPYVHKVRARHVIRVESWRDLKAVKCLPENFPADAVGSDLKKEQQFRALVLDRERELRERMLMRLAVSTNKTRLRQHLPPVVLVDLTSQARQRPASV
eukprot:TRINITY_DN10850_c0_g3_i1.p1 TRINITY_DN10850_c0_g3~~TRINITY_DN10850_c0_g3_i1.p1  ORF type:complete len:1302 (+),score=336.67 TRINITY_DN10850_c0_g3_i1:554-3907(+)